jgi:hypothetical protein
VLLNGHQRAQQGHGDRFLIVEVGAEQLVQFPERRCASARRQPAVGAVDEQGVHGLVLLPQPVQRRPAPGRQRPQGRPDHLVLAAVVEAEQPGHPVHPVGEQGGVPVVPWGRKCVGEAAELRPEHAVRQQEAGEVRLSGGHVPPPPARARR